MFHATVADPAEADPDIGPFRCPDSLPIHLAAGEGRRDGAFCTYLVGRFPESVRATNAVNMLPMHSACLAGTLDAVKCLAKIYPQAVCERTSLGFLPVHEAIFNKVQRLEIFLSFSYLWTKAACRRLCLALDTRKTEICHFTWRVQMNVLELERNFCLMHIQRPS